MIIRYISDPHLFDPYSYSWRQETKLDVDEYARQFVYNWNSVVMEDDMTVIVGDVGQLCERTLEYIRCLNGIRILVVGNHDVSWGSELYNQETFHGTHQFINSNGVFVQHIPDDSITRNVPYFIHGHHHRYDMPGMQIKLDKYYRDVHRLNCSADLIGHIPRTLQELILQKELLMEKYKKLGILKED